MVGTKKTSVYRKKRKGAFSGRRKQEQYEYGVEDHESIREGFDGVVGPSTSTPGKSPVKGNKSFEKISRNCPLLEKDYNNILTRKRALSLGIEPGKKKRRKTVDEGNSSTADHSAAHGFKLIKIHNLQDALLKTAICGSCKSAKGKLTILQNDHHRNGLDEELIIKCKNCNESTYFRTSPVVKGVVGKSSAVNVRSIQAAIETGLGLTHMQKLCTAFGLPPPLSHTAYNNLMKKFQACYAEEANLSLQKAALNLKNHMKKEDCKCQDLDPSSDIFEVCVSVDGTWQKRYGHSSLLGVVFVLAIETGEILDYEVRSKVCFECKSREHDKESENYKRWWEDHKDRCEINHKGSAEAMEKDAAVVMFLRSIEKHKLKYITYVGDGDSSSYGVVADAVFQRYGAEYVIMKEDCIGHIQKRMGNNLRTYKNNAKGSKLADGCSVGGRGRLTDVTIDSLQNYYGYAIRANSNNLQKMQDAVWAIYYHTILGQKETLAVQHKYCPKGNESWCKYQKDIACKTNTYHRSKCLPSVFRQELLPIFKRLSRSDLLSRCLRGFTQNQNESLNNVLWLKCPKRVFCGKRKLETATAAAVLYWNKGAAACSNVLERFGIQDPGINTLRGYRRLNLQRIKCAAQKCKMKYKKQRRLLRKKRKEGTKTGQHYLAGGFSILKVPDSVIVQNEEKKKPTNMPSSGNSRITFVDEKDIALVVENPKKREKSNKGVLLSNS